MRDLTGTTLGEDQKAMGDAKCKIVLTKTDLTTYTYYIDSGDDRILSLRHTEQEWSQTAQVAIQDSSHTVADLSPDLRGYKGIISYGYGANYSDCAPLWVVAQKTDSFGGGIVTSLSLAGTFNLMSEDRASAAYTPDSSNTDTVKTILTAVCEKTLAPFTHCTSYEATFDVSTGIIDTFMPKDSFRIYLNDTRLSVIKRLMKHVGYKCRVEDDAEIHFFIPTVSSSTYDYEYENVVTEHNFYDKSVRKRVVIPNYVVVSSHPDHESPYAGWTGYKADTTDDGDIEKREYRYFRVTSDAQCVSIATNILLHHQMDAEKGHGFAPMNCGQEVFDYVNITDSRVGDERAGNIGYINREYTPGKFTMEFRFGSVAPGQYLGTMPPQMTTAAGISTAALAEQIMTLWDNQMALVDAIIETKQEVIDIEPDAGIPSGGIEGGITWRSIFDGSVDTPTSAAWALEAGLPFTLTGAYAYFSPVIEEIPDIYVVYVIDRGTNFWKYNITEKKWYKLASPTYNVGTTGNIDRSLVPNSLNTKLACISEATNNYRGGYRIEFYTIGTDTWSASSQVDDLDDEGAVSRDTVIAGLVWADSDTIWCWASQAHAGVKDYCYAVKYTVSNDTFTSYATCHNGALTLVEPRSAAIKSTEAGTATEEQTTNNTTLAMYGANAPNAGQRLTIANREVTKLTFLLLKNGSPTGNVAFQILKVSDDSVVASKVWGDAASLSSEAAWKEVTLDSPVTINEEVRTLVNHTTGDATNNVGVRCNSANVKDDELLTRGEAGSWSDVGTYDCAYKYTYATTASLIIYGSLIGTDIKDCCKYTIADDSYAKVTLSAGHTWSFATDNDKLWYMDTTDRRQGYLDTADDSENADQFSENTDRTNSGNYHNLYGTDGAYIIAHSRSTTPELMSVMSGGAYLLGTLYASGWTPVLIEKPSDNYVVLVVNAADNVTLSYDHTVQTTLWDGTWKFYYPQTGDETQVKIYYGVS